MTPEQFYARATSGDGCWEWQGTLDTGGYGRLWLRGLGSRTAHRVSWQIANGAIPDGLHVLHHCDTPACIRPDHLTVGSHVENMRQMKEHGHARGHVAVQIDVGSVAATINRLGSIAGAAKELGIARQTIHRMVKDGRLLTDTYLVFKGERRLINKAA